MIPIQKASIDLILKNRISRLYAVGSLMSFLPRTLPTSDLHLYKQTVRHLRMHWTNKKKTFTTHLRWTGKNRLISQTGGSSVIIVRLYCGKYKHTKLVTTPSISNDYTKSVQ